MAQNIVSFSGGSVTVNGNGDAVSITARGTARENITLSRINSGTERGEKFGSSFSGVFLTGHMNEIAGIIGATPPRQVTIRGDGGPPEFQPINYSSP
jgi:hypothetical protein